MTPDEVLREHSTLVTAALVVGFLAVMGYAAWVFWLDVQEAREAARCPDCDGTGFDWECRTCQWCEGTGKNHAGPMPKLTRYHDV